jgi:phosphoserine phosphatase
MQTNDDQKMRGHLVLVSGSQSDGDGTLRTIDPVLGRSLANLIERPLARSSEHAAVIGPLDASAVDHFCREILDRFSTMYGCDHFFVPLGQSLSDFSVLAMDMDSTVINIECIDELADFIGKKAEVAAITAAAMRGEIKDYGESLRQRVRLLEGLEVKALDSLIEERLRINPGAEELITRAKQHGVHTMLVSGGFSPITDHVASALGFDEVVCNTLGVEATRFNGTVVGPIIDGLAKQAAVADRCKQRLKPSSSAIVFGDGSNDIPMMQIAGMSVAYRAKPAVREVALARIDHGRLDSLLLAWDESLKATV